MDAGAVPELSAKRNRFWRLPLSSRVTNRKRCEHRPGLHVIAKSRASGRRLARSEFVTPESFRGGLDLSHEPEKRSYITVSYINYTCCSHGPVGRLCALKSKAELNRPSASYHGGVGHPRGVGRGLGVTLGVAVAVGLAVGLVVGVGVGVTS